jgi:hypothetical protein|nr:MAG TPA: hypothetical protein [Caudoviricetes sp.]
MMDDRERRITDLQRYLDGWRRRWHKQHKKQEIKAKKRMMILRWRTIHE